MQRHGPVRRWAGVVAAGCAAAMASFTAGPEAAGEEMFLKAKKVTAVGLADIEGGNLAAAKDLAVKQAIRKAIEEVIGFFVESTFTAEEKAS